MAEVKRVSGGRGIVGRRIGVVNTRTGEAQKEAQRAQEFATASSYATKIAESVQVTEATRKANLTPTRDADGKLEYAERPAFLGGAGGAKYDAIYQERYFKQAGLDLNSFVQGQAAQNPTNAAALKKNATDYIATTVKAMKKDGAGELAERFREYSYKVTDDYASKVELNALKQKEINFLSDAREAHDLMFRDANTALSNGDTERAKEIFDLIEQDVSNNLAGYTKEYVGDVRRASKLVNFEGLMNDLIVKDQLSTLELPDLNVALLTNADGKYKKAYPELFEAYQAVSFRSRDRADSHISKMIRVAAAAESMTKADLSYFEFEKTPSYDQDKDGSKSQRFIQSLEPQIPMNNVREVASNLAAREVFVREDAINHMRQAGVPEFIRSALKGMANGQDLQFYGEDAVNFAVETAYNSMVNEDGSLQNKYSDREKAFILSYRGIVNGGLGAENAAEAYTAARNLASNDPAAKAMIASKLGVSAGSTKSSIMLARNNLEEELTSRDPGMSLFGGKDFNPQAVNEFAGLYANLLLNPAISKDAALDTVEKIYESTYTHEPHVFGNMAQRFGPSHYYNSFSGKRRAKFYEAANFVGNAMLDQLVKEKPALAKELPTYRQLGKHFKLIPAPNNTEISGSFIFVHPDTGQPFRNATGKPFEISTTAIDLATNASIAHSKFLLSLEEDRIEAENIKKYGKYYKMRSAFSNEVLNVTRGSLF